MSANDNIPTLSIFLTNLQAYNSGSLTGMWVNLPITAEEFHDDLKNIGIGQENEFGEVAEEWFVTDYDSVIPGISNLDDVGEYPDLNKLNQIAADYDNLPSWKQELVQSLMETSYAPETLNELGNLLNDSYALEDINIIPNGADDEELGEYYVDNVYGDVNELSSETIENYFDYESLGREVKLEESGENVGFDYVLYDDVELDDSLPDYNELIELDLEEDREELQELEPGMPADGILPGLPETNDTLDLKLVNPKFVPDYYEYNFTDSVWISLPIEKEDYLQALCNIGIGNPPDGSENEEFQIAGVVSRIPGITEMNEKDPFTQGDIDTLNQIARDYDELKSYQQETLEQFYKTSAYPDTLNELDNLIAYNGLGNRYNGLDNIQIYENCADDYNYGQYLVEEAGMPLNPEYYFDYESFGQDVRMDMTGEKLENGDFLQLDSSFQLDDDELDISEDLFDYEEEPEEEREEEHPFSPREQFLRKLQPVKNLQNQQKLKNEQEKTEEPEQETPEKEKPHD